MYSHAPDLILIEVRINGPNIQDMKGYSIVYPSATGSNSVPDTSATDSGRAAIDCGVTDHRTFLNTKTMPGVQCRRLHSCKRNDAP